MSTIDSKKHTISYEIVTPDGPFGSGEASYISLPGADGRFGVMPMHTSMIAVLEPGVMSYQDQNGTTTLEIGYGTVKIDRNRAIILTAFAKQQL
ncbi:MAG: F0F1 ATP synthase subunit epsilon [Firmicutes bacterium]|nr:F0F1 ATP synthase subunit epsilon [Bacillota bacterium]